MSGKRGEERILVHGIPVIRHKYLHYRGACPIDAEGNRKIRVYTGKFPPWEIARSLIALPIRYDDYFGKPGVVEGRADSGTGGLSGFAFEYPGRIGASITSVNQTANASLRTGKTFEKQREDRWKKVIDDRVNIPIFPHVSLMVLSIKLDGRLRNLENSEVSCFSNFNCRSNSSGVIAPDSFFSLMENPVVCFSRRELPPTRMRLICRINYIISGYFRQKYVLAEWPRQGKH
jgi:hypothetical protein